MNILVTGAAGFIGYHVCKKLLSYKTYKVFGIDNFNEYYDVELKKNRIKDLKETSSNFKIFKLDLKNYSKLNANVKKNKYQIVIHLAAQAGVRYSIENPKNYLDNNINAFFNILDVSKKYKIKHLLYASTSSVYGDSKKFPLNENLYTDKPLSFYAATKKCNEVMAETYSNLFNFKCTGLRFFTVYGPYGRPDMALFKFTKAIIMNRKIDLYNQGKHYRDFTYIDDIVEGIVNLMSSKNKYNHEVFNVGNGKPEYLMKYIRIIEKRLGKKAKFKMMSKQIGDVEKTHADIKKISKNVSYFPKTDIAKGVNKFIDWYLGYYRK